ncbi:hypothetical protein IVB12_15485 [Bradyrhizobium sp. 179]|uniref:hypothetical protein n=1 Tax=Bradyrhizobium sp. 179 TaxID=2782648 RepID=UPI001FFC0F70|nr:hypothetical protein [Bradyrhizobium sp. 179]MCK1543317.1 hypothetical protein [Bradyrhizobium sp. 179]
MKKEPTFWGSMIVRQRMPGQRKMGLYLVGLFVEAHGLKGAKVGFDYRLPERLQLRLIEFILDPANMAKGREFIAREEKAKFQRYGKRKKALLEQDKYWLIKYFPPKSNKDRTHRYPTKELADEAAKRIRALGGAIISRKVVRSKSS